MAVDWKQVVKAFYAKAAYKGFQFTGIEQLINAQNDKRLKAAWKNSLEHQITQGTLPDYESVRADLWTLFTNIFKSF